ncbi:probable serine/threonine-protein kinase DDB_G0275165 isoform X1 [Leptopilina boulardi]|uniref:probable serine/threonine-protein kinase DDB_G0275165 isoform X1 n=1 Tax=Leptopilina boulardi TaxID=63433 RepID=UPI0021F65B09|nr:probable serine/threonine-protein kinase DDB_G0275165 isoform X1 [Leptopilina boulardi]XP_051164596.1 probable serine/threonine-protein kinase DDB_G0275165 isoform X1 [Leptopilina boulardi]
MRLKLLKLVTCLLLAGSGESRPQNSAPYEGRADLNGNGWKPIPIGNEDVSQTFLSNSRPRTSDSQRQLKDLQHMDQSLRTVATQLLNVTNPKEILQDDKKQQPSNDILTKLIFVESSEKDAEEIQDSSVVVKTIDSLNFEKNSTKHISQERPINSKFGFLESSHPGEAMALTEEELEKELNSMRHPIHKVQPTTTGGISTWILLNPPSATTDLPLDDEEKTKYPPSNEGQFIVKTTSTIQKVESTDQKKATASVEKVTTTQTPISFEKIYTQVPKKSTPNLIRKSTTPSTLKLEKLMIKTEKVTQQSEKLTANSEKTTQIKKIEKQSTTPKTTTTKSISEVKETNSISPDNSEIITAATTPKSVITKKIPSTIRTTAKPKTANQNNKNLTQAKNTTTKAPKPQNKPKPTPQRKTTTIKPETHNSPTPKIEKVTFKPVQMIASHSDITEVPMFITKIKASVYTETKKTPPPELSTPKPTTKLTTKSSAIKEEPIKFKPSGNKVNNVLQVKLKKPMDDMTKIEIEPIKVNAPVLKIEKVDSSKKNSKIDHKKIEHSKNEHQEILNNSKIDFNSELTKINIDTQKPSSTTTTTTTVKPTSKRRQSSKRKKNKNRRRKPTITTESTDTALSALSTIAEVLNIAESSSAENAIQESKIEPETKVTNSTKTKKKQVQKPISTQIYNFLSREVMPSFGVMSLVGLGLGLASYFLYPFGGSIARRNYELEPNYKYNLDEYGGNYGQNEEEVFSKVLQGMTKHDNKYQTTNNNNNNNNNNNKDYENNYYKYHHYDTTTRKTEQKQTTSSGPIYRPVVENSYDVNYRNTEFKYPDLPTTPNYYERQKQSDFTIGKEGNKNRQFVVGNIPKEYSSEEKESSLSIASKRADYENEGPSKFEREMAQNFNFPKNSVNIPQAYTQVEPHRKNDDVYEEIEITPTAVAVEHGPRLLRVRRSNFLKNKRDSVIQLIPSKSEIEKEHQEEEVPLSNEIFDIIDSAIPVNEDDLKKEVAKEKMKEKMKDDDIKKKLEDEKNFIQNEIIHSESTTKMTSLPTVKYLTTSTGKIETSKSEATTFNSKTKNSTHFKNEDTTTEDWFNNDEVITTEKSKTPENEGFSIFSIVKKIAEIKIKLGLTLLKHASEGFARYLGHVQKKFNGEE